MKKNNQIENRHDFIEHNISCGILIYQSKNDLNIFINNNYIIYIYNIFNGNLIFTIKIQQQQQQQ